MSIWSALARDELKADALDADFEERAAIMEFDGGLSREEAEKMARAALSPHEKRGCGINNTTE